MDTLKTILKVFSVLFILCSFSSCTSWLDKESVLIIEQIDVLNKDQSIYTVTDRNKYSEWNFSIVFTDARNKFSVGDTVYFSKQH